MKRSTNTAPWRTGSVAWSGAGPAAPARRRRARSKLRLLLPPMAVFGPEELGFLTAPGIQDHGGRAGLPPVVVDGFALRNYEQLGSLRGLAPKRVKGIQATEGHFLHQLFGVVGSIHPPRRVSIQLIAVAVGPQMRRGRFYFNWRR